MTKWESEKQNVSSRGQKGLKILTLMKESVQVFTGLKSSWLFNLKKKKRARKNIHTVETKHKEIWSEILISTLKVANF